MRFQQTRGGQWRLRHADATTKRGAPLDSGEEGDMNGPMAHKGPMQARGAPETLCGFFFRGRGGVSCCGRAHVREQRGKVGRKVLWARTHHCIARKVCKA